AAPEFSTLSLHDALPILITSESLQFCNDGTIWFKTAQVSHLGSAIFGKQIGINLICFGSRGTTVSINGLGIDRIDRVSGFKQPRSEEHTSELQSLRHLVC